MPQDRFRFFGRNPFNVRRKRRVGVDDLLPSLRVGSDDRMMLDGVLLPHLLFFAFRDPFTKHLHEVMNGDQPVNPFLPLIAEPLVGPSRIGETGVTPDRGNNHPSQDRPHRRFSPPGHVAVPACSNKRGTGVAPSFQNDDFWMVRVIEGERVHFQFTKHPAKSNVLLLSDVLITQHKHLVLQPHPSEFFGGVATDVGEVNAGDLGAQRRSDGMNCKCHTFPLNVPKEPDEEPTPDASLNRFRALRKNHRTAMSATGRVDTVNGAWLWLLVGAAVVLLAVTVYDLTQRRHAILRNYPVIGHFRYLLEAVGPELRQYIVTDNDEERPFSRDQRRWVYASAKNENSYFGFGTDNDLDQPGYPYFHHSPFPHDGEATGPIPCLKTLGEWRNRAEPHTPESIVAISAMSFGALSSAAIVALNRGASLARSLHNTGEGGISSHHRHGGDLVFQLGTGYFGARNPDGTFSMEHFLASIDSTPVRAIEVKLSQGAKPGLGGRLPAEKVTAEIAEARGVPVNVTVQSPARHPAFGDVVGLIDFIERLADASGKPVGIKSAVGDHHFWNELAEAMATTGRGPDFISVDGGEGGTGAAPLVFADHVALPFRHAFPTVRNALARHGLDERVVLIGAGKLGIPPNGGLALAMGADMLAVAREAMLAVGCVQAQKCHTGHCPTGVATQNPRLVRGLDPTDKSVRVANYLLAFQHDLMTLAHAMGHDHPARITLDQVSLADGRGGLHPAKRTD